MATIIYYLLTCSFSEMNTEGYRNEYYKRAKANFLNKLPLLLVIDCFILYLILK